MHPIPAIKDVMTPFPHFIEAEASVADARAMMQTHKIRHLPVKGEGRLLGLITDRDIEVAQSVLRDGKSLEVPLVDLCTKDLYVVGLHTPLDEVVTEMNRRKVGFVLVVRDERLAGILTTSDVCRIYGDLLRKLAPPKDEPA